MGSRVADGVSRTCLEPISTSTARTRSAQARSISGSGWSYTANEWNLTANSFGGQFRPSHHRPADAIRCVSVRVGTAVCAESRRGPVAGIAFEQPATDFNRAPLPPSGVPPVGAPSPHRAAARSLFGAVGYVTHATFTSRIMNPRIIASPFAILTGTTASQGDPSGASSPGDGRPSRALGRCGARMTWHRSCTHQKTGG